MDKTLPTIHLIVAARPNFMKVAPLYHELTNAGWCHPLLVHTGQHYDANMSAAFLRDLSLPEPDIHLRVGSGTHAEQTAGVMVAYEKVCLQSPPDYVVVVGDVNSTLAVAITAKKLWLPVAHLEAGLRSRDRSMPEEINRIVTDALADLLWTPSPDANENLAAEGVPAEKIEMVGNIMIDSYELMRPQIEADPGPARLGLPNGGYAVVTLHRPSNVDDPDRFSQLVRSLQQISQTLPLVFPVHPRTRKRLEDSGLGKTLEKAANIPGKPAQTQDKINACVDPLRLLVVPRLAVVLGTALRGGFSSHPPPPVLFLVGAGQSPPRASSSCAGAWHRSARPGR